MRFDDLIQLTGGRSWFDFETLVQMSGESRQSLTTQLHRWRQARKVVPLRRGLYALGATYRKRDLNPVELAAPIYAPSYLSLHWALGCHGLIPEQVTMLTSVTSRQTRRFENPVGVFDYRHVADRLFHGCRLTPVGGTRAMIATPEKALLDFWYLEHGTWGMDRMREMRFQNFQVVDRARLRRDALAFDSPRIATAVANWELLADSEEESGVEL